MIILSIWASSDAYDNRDDLFQLEIQLPFTFSTRKWYTIRNDLWLIQLLLSSAVLLLDVMVFSVNQRRKIRPPILCYFFSYFVCIFDSHTMRWDRIKTKFLFLYDYSSLFVDCNLLLLCKNGALVSWYLISSEATINDSACVNNHQRKQYMTR